MDCANARGCGRSRCLDGAKDGESAQRSMFDSESVGELATEEALDVSESMDSSLILVCRGSRILMGRIAGTLRFEKDLVAMALVDFEHGDSSIGVTLIREEGESKDCDRMRTLGDGVLGGAMVVAMLMRPQRQNEVTL